MVVTGTLPVFNLTMDGNSQVTGLVLLRLHVLHNMNPYKSKQKLKCEINTLGFSLVFRTLTISWLGTVTPWCQVHLLLWYQLSHLTISKIVNIF